jgi:hypothetical protein
VCSSGKFVKRLTFVDKSNTMGNQASTKPPTNINFNHEKHTIEILDDNLDCIASIPEVVVSNPVFAPLDIIKVSPTRIFIYDRVFSSAYTIDVSTFKLENWSGEHFEAYSIFQSMNWSIVLQCQKKYAAVHNISTGEVLKRIDVENGLAQAMSQDKFVVYRVVPYPTISVYTTRSEKPTVYEFREFDPSFSCCTRINETTLCIYSLNTCLIIDIETGSSTPIRRIKKLEKVVSLDGMLVLLFAKSTWIYDVKNFYTCMKLQETSQYQLCIHNRWYYYLYQSTLYRINIDTKELETLATNVARATRVDRERLYYVSRETPKANNIAQWMYSKVATMADNNGYIYHMKSGVTRNVHAYRDFWSLYDFSVKSKNHNWRGTMLKVNKFSDIVIVH